MASDGDSEDEALESLEFEYNSDAEDEIDESILDAIEGDLAAEEAASEEVCFRIREFTGNFVLIYYNRIGHRRR